MRNINAFETSVAGIYGIGGQIKHIAKFLVDNRDQVRIPLEIMNEILKTKVLSTTPISQLFDSMLKNRKQELFAPLNIPDSISPPEVITMNHIVIDVKQMKDIDRSTYSAICTLPEYRDKIILNLTPLLKKKSPSTVTDMNELQSLMVRGLLVRSYYDSENWLTPALIEYLGESYSMTISSNIARNYNLTYKDQMVIATILTTYFHQKCYGSVKKGEFPVTINNCSYLGSRVEITDRLETFKDILGEDDLDLNIDKVCDLIAKTGSGRIEKFQQKILLTINKSLGSDQISALTAIEYPPFWAHQILLALSGVKSGMQWALKNQGKLFKNGAQFADTLIRTSAFIPEL